MKRIFILFGLMLPLISMAEKIDLGGGYTMESSDPLFSHAAWNLQLIYTKSLGQGRVIWPSLTIIPGQAENCVKDGLAIFTAGLVRAEKSSGLEAALGASLDGSPACLVTFEILRLHEKLGLTNKQCRALYDLFSFKRNAVGLEVAYYRRARDPGQPELLQVLVTWDELRVVVKGVLTAHKELDAESTKYFVATNDSG